jgi:hypothetical protein
MSADTQSKSVLKMLVRREPLLFKVMRLGAFLTFVQLLVTGLLAHGVRAQLQDLVQSTGAQMMQLAGTPAENGVPRTLRLNGAQIRLRAQRLPGRTLEDVLDQFQARCRAHNGRFFEQLQQAPETSTWSEKQIGLLDGVLRVDGPEEGSIACMDVGDEKASPSSVLERAQKFVSTGDLASFGGLRMLRAEKRERGVFAVMMWTDGPLNIKQMFPTSGDAPGVDFPDLPRPPGSRRILSAWEEGQSPAINVYEHKTLKPAQLDRFYRAELPKRGWDPLLQPSKGEDLLAHPLMVVRDGVTVALSQTDLHGEALATTTIMPMDTAGAIEAAAVP